MASTLFWVGGSGTLSSASTANWSTTTGGAPGAGPATSSTDLVFDANSGAGTVTLSGNVSCNSINAAASSVKTWSQTSTSSITIGSSTVGLGNVALDFGGITTLTTSGNLATAWNFVSTSATQQTVNFNGLNLGGLAATFNGLGGSWLLTTSMTTTGQFQNMTLTAGTLNTNGLAHTWGNFISTNSNVRTLTLGASVITLLNTGGSTWSTGVATNMTITANTATINSPTTTAAATWMAAGTLNFNGATVVLRGGSGANGITGACTLAGLNISGAGAGVTTIGSTCTVGALSITAGRTVKFTAGITVTITSLSATGTSGSKITLNSTANGSTWTISAASGTISGSWLVIQDSTATGGASFIATNSTNTSNNTGWVFPVSSSGFLAFM